MSQTTPIITQQTATSEAEKVISVEQLNRDIRQLIEGQIPMVWVRGELSNFKAHTSGHFYFSLKDSKSQIRAVMFRGHNSKLRFKPTDGLEVLIRARVTVYEPRGEYQLACEMMEPVGAGALQKAFEQLKDKLRAEGLFEASRKRALPAFPKHIAIVTSPTGAAIRDMMNILSRRNRSVPVTVIPTIVQGETAAPQIVEAMKKAFQIPDVDVIIVGRGGGSIEDMWCFNNEALARCIVSSPVPVISAVGHEIDFTIADFVADLRAPTPSAAAELVVKNTEELANRISQLDRLLQNTWKKVFHVYKEKLRGIQKQLLDPRRKLQDAILRNDELTTRLEKAIQNSFEKKHLRLKMMASLMDSLSPLRVLDRGFSLTKKDSQLVRSVKQLKANDQITVDFFDGQIQANILTIQEK